jgi:AcrR family transcriptional regulator
MDIRERIILAAKEHFMKYGISRVRMDDLATDLGMSKKTLYQHFESKEDLAHAVAEYMFKTHECTISNILKDETMDFITKLKNIFAFILNHAGKMTDTVMQDMKRSMPQLWEKVENFRQHSIHREFKELVEQGIRKGLFRKDIKVDLLVSMYFGAIHYTMQPEALSKATYTPSEAFNGIFRVFMEGIMTEETRKKFVEAVQYEQSLANSPQKDLSDY